MLRALAEDHQALVADVRAGFLGHGPAAGDPPSRLPVHAIMACGAAA